jgi:L-amino acid N-acyltransferase YncA
MTQIRPANAGDAAQIAEILNPILRDTTISFTEVERSEDDIIEAIESHHSENLPFLVAVKAGRVKGVASYTQFRKGPGYARTMEHTIYVTPDAFGAGIGRILMAALEAHARLSGVTTLIGGISAENTAGIAFHSRLGFVLTGHLPGVGHKFGRNLDLILMQKSLVTP